PAPTPGRSHLSGKVTSSAGGPVIGARVRVSFDRGEVSEPLALVSTEGPEGTYAADLPRLEQLTDMERATGHLAVAASAPRHRPSEPLRVSLLPPGAPGSLVANLVLEAGGTLRGRVFRTGDLPVAGAWVILSTDAGAETG